MKIYYPSLKLLLHLIKRLRSLYPSDYIRIFSIEALLFQEEESIS